VDACQAAFDSSLYNSIIASVAVAVDLFVVFRLIWFGMLREIPKESGMTAREAFRYVGRSLGQWAKERKELEKE
jgi:hypothetical protein